MGWGVGGEGGWGGMGLGMGLRGGAWKVLRTGSRLVRGVPHPGRPVIDCHVLMFATASVGDAKALYLGVLNRWFNLSLPAARFLVAVDRLGRL